MPDVRQFVRNRLAPLALSPEREQKIVDEWSAQLEDLYDALRADGLSDEAAWVELQRQLPDWPTLGSQLSEAGALRARDRGGMRRPARARERLARGVVGDVTAALRLSLKSRGYTAAVVFTLATCLGVTAAIFAVVDAVLLRPLPVPEPERIVGVGDVYPTITPNDILANDVPSYFERLTALTAFEAQGMFAFWFDTFTIDGSPRELRGIRATPSLFRVLQVAPALGRTFTEEEGEIGGERKIVLSHGLWQQLYGGDPHVIGRALRLAWTGQPYTIVGVMPRDFTFFDQGYPGHAGDARAVQFWIPLAFTPEQRSDAARARYGFFHLGRLRAGATIDQLQAQLDALHATNVARFPQLRFAELGMKTLATPLQEAFTRRIRRPLAVLAGGAAFVLLIGVFNVANLSLARANARRRELVTRFALGASWWRVARQLLAEALVPVAAGGVAGLAVAATILQALTLTGIDELPNAAGIGLSTATVVFVVTSSLAIGLLIALVAASVTGTPAINQVLAENSRSGSGGRAAALFRQSMIVSQVGLSVVLLFAATLLLTSVRHLLSLDGGFAPTGVVTATIFPPPSRYPDAAAMTALQDRVLDRVRIIPGVQAAGLTSNIALSGYESPSTVSTGEPADPGEPTIVPSVVAVTPGYFETMSTPIVRGRDFSDGDRSTTRRVAIVDEQLAGRLWPGGDPIEKRLYRGDSGPFTVIGVVRRIHLSGLTEPQSMGTAYFPHTQAPPLGRLRWIAIRSAADSAAVVRQLRAALLDIDPDLPIADVQTMRERIDRTLVSERLAANLATIFAVIALSLSIVGIYAVLAGVVARRTREIGIRMALGSSVRTVFRMVLTEGAALIGVGLLLGVGGAFAAARALDGLVFGIQPTDARLLSAVVAVTAAIALLACLAPARRAARINPVDVLSQT
jgi:putative ABC transport system permease protein